MDNEALINKLKAEHYDVYLTGPFDFCSFALNHILKIKSVNTYSVLGQDGYLSFKLGLPMLPSYVPQLFDGIVYGKNKGFMHRLRSFLYMADFELDEEGMSLSIFWLIFSCCFLGNFQF